MKGVELPVRQFDLAKRYPVPTRVELRTELPDDAPRPEYRGVTERFWLEWTYAWDDPPFSPPAVGCLDEFIKLADAPPERVRDFARRWGVLGICAHGDPYPHRSGPDGGCHPLGVPTLGPAFDPSGSLAWDALRPWYRYARKARAIVSAAARLYANEAPDDDDWREIEGGVFSREADALDQGLEQGLPPGVQEAQRRMEAAAKARFDERFEQHMRPRREIPELARRELADAVSEWLGSAALLPRLRWDTGADSYVAIIAPRDPDFWSGTYGHLFGLLGIQLAAAVSSPLYHCSICSTVYGLEDDQNRPRRGQRRFCSDDCAAEGKRQGNLRSYHKNKGHWPRQRRKENSSAQ